MPRKDGSRIDATLRRLARPQLGLIVTADAGRAGVGHAALSRRRASGEVEDVFAGVVRLAAAACTHEQRILAAALAVPGSSIAASSAAFVSGMPVGVREEPILAVELGRSARSPGIVTIRQRVSLPSRPWHTARLATPESTLVMLPRFEAPATVERCLDHCLAHRLTTVERVRDLIADLPPRAVAGRRVLIDLLAERTTGMGHRSGLEQRVARWLDEAGLRGWQRNLRIPVSGGVVEVDFAWPDARVALEVSRFFTHGSRTAQERDAERRRLLVAEGWCTVDATDPDLISPTTFAACAASVRAVLRVAPPPLVA